MWGSGLLLGVAAWWESELLLGLCFSVLLGGALWLLTLPGRRRAGRQRLAAAAGPGGAMLSFQPTLLRPRRIPGERSGPRRAPAPVAAVPGEVAAPGAAVSAADVVAAASIADWLARCISAMHVLVLGASRVGKTVVTHAVAVARAEAGHAVYVADPDARPGMWPGCTVVGGGDDWPAIEAQCAAVIADVSLRRRLRMQGWRQFSPVTVVLSDASSIMAECPSAVQVFAWLLRRGGKLGYNLIVDVQDKQVKTLQIPGASQLLKSFDVQLEVAYVGGQFDPGRARFVGGRRIVRLLGGEADVGDLPDPEALGDAWLAAHPDVAAELRELAERAANGLPFAESEPDLLDELLGDAPVVGLAAVPVAAVEAGESEADRRARWSADVLRAFALVLEEPALLHSRTRLAQRLWGGSGKGNANIRAGELCKALADSGLLARVPPPGERSGVPGVPAVETSGIVEVGTGERSGVDLVGS